MLRSMFISLLALGSVWSRDPIRTRSVPSISNSLVNLGKMDITFHINGAKDNEISQRDQFMPFSNPKPLNPPPTIDECMCNSLRNNFKDNIFGGTSEIFNKILMSNDFLNNNNNPITSAQCCESHEENIITFDFGPKTAGNLPKPIVPFQQFQQNMPSIIFDSFLPKKLPFSQTSSLKPKAIEIFLFPKNRDGKKPWISSISSLPRKTVKKDIKIVGDKDNKYFDTVKLETMDKLKPTDNLKYETVTEQPVTEKKQKEIGIKDQEDYNKPEVKEEPQKEEVSSVSYQNSV